ncbi:MAG: M3 family metallopeptidase, partial [Bacteroidales bacterium]
TAKRLRATILERGGTKEAMEMYKDFRGREPIVEPLLKQRGLD